ncbi:hypothetical protein [Pleomorphomonas koreensis]|uniref:hypothetical protein n=1 Tax=Pleomorphomonas koreensis TaxID=257440 RepID=UPI00047E2D96|nr:hypothetical protein [Pleomorphomonas koreensis]
MDDISSPSGVFRNVGFSVRQGEVLGIAGIVGAGRTELVRVIAGADPISTGRSAACRGVRCDSSSGNWRDGCDDRGGVPSGHRPWLATSGTWVPVISTPDDIPIAGFDNAPFVLSFSPMA